MYSLPFTFVFEFVKGKILFNKIKAIYSPKATKSLKPISTRYDEVRLKTNFRKYNCHIENNSSQNKSGKITFCHSNGKQH